MSQTELLSVSLFKQHISVHLAGYLEVESDNVLVTLQQAISNSGNDSFHILKQELEKISVNIGDVLEDYISDLADHFVQNPNISDSIINQLLRTNFLSFVSKVEAAQEVRVAIQRVERKRLKELLQEQEELQEEEDLRIVLQRFERKSKKQLLQEIENQNEFEVAQENNTNHVDQSASMSKKPNSAKANWNFVIRIAAIFILFLIPVGVSVFFFNGNSNSVPNGNSNENQETNGTVYAETGDLKELRSIDIPVAISSNASTKLKSNEITQGYGQDYQKQDNISITLISYKNQITYLNNKIDSLESKYKELQTKKIKNKQITLQSINDTKLKCSKEKIKLLALESTYDFKNNNLKLFKQERIDLKSIKVYSLNDENEHKVYYLQIEEEYFSLLMVKGKLIKVVDEAIIDELDNI
jgi:hypothetical protein